MHTSQIPGIPHDVSDFALYLEPLFVNVGANIGAYTILASACGGARSIGIEALPATFDKLLRNIAVNRIGRLCHSACERGPFVSREGTGYLTASEHDNHGETILESQSILVHASNVTGLGATHVVCSLVTAFEKLGCRFDYVVPAGKAWSNGLDVGKERIKSVKRYLPRVVSRFIECFFARQYFQQSEGTIVLGDIPLRGMPNQIVLVHQSNLISSAVNPFSSGSVSFIIMRLLFRTLAKDVRYFVVQSGAMKDQLIASYPALKDKVMVITQPAPAWLRCVEIEKRINFNDGLKLFYPAAGYPHKNHGLFMLEPEDSCFFEELDELVITLTGAEILPFRNIPEKVHNIGRVSTERCMQVYSEVDALFYPSLTESYGLPLVEAMVLGLPVIAADLPYARWMCEDEAIYFDPEDIVSAGAAIKEAKYRLTSGWRPDWSAALGKLPPNWDEVGKRFIELLE